MTTDILVRGKHTTGEDINVSFNEDTTVLFHFQPTMVRYIITVTSKNTFQGVALPVWDEIQLFPYHDYI